MKYLILMVALLTGCATKLPEPVVRVPASLKQKCPKLSPLEGNTGADMLRNIVANSESYYKCSDMHDKLIEAITSEK